MKQAFLIFILLLPAALGLQLDGNISLDDEAHGIFLIRDVENPFSLKLPEDAEIWIDGNPAGNPVEVVRDCRIEWEAKSPLEKNSKNFFLFDLKLPEGTWVKLRLALPQGSWLERSFPEAGISTDGKRIYLSWERRLGRDSMTIFVIFGTQQSLSWLLLLLPIPILLFLWFYFRKPREKLYLLPDEKLVFSLIKKQGELRQRDILKQVDFSKAKVSRIIRRLQEMGLIEVVPRGNTNLIRLKK